MEVNKIELSWSDLFVDKFDEYCEHIINFDDQFHIRTQLSLKLKDGEGGVYVSRVFYPEKGRALTISEIQSMQSDLRYKVKQDAIKFISQSIKESAEKLRKGSEGIVSSPEQTLNIFSHG